MKMFLSYLSFLFLVCVLTTSICEASFTPRVTFQLEAPARRQETPNRNPVIFDDENEIPTAITDIANRLYHTVLKTFSELIKMMISAFLPIYYGLGLLVYGRLLPNQVLAITVIRVTGYGALESAIRKMNANVRDAIATTIMNSPSLAMAAKTIMTLNERKEGAKRIMQETRKAKRDGIITTREANTIAKLQRKHLRKINRDIRRLKRGTNSLIQIWNALDFREIGAVLRDFVLEMLLVLSSVHGDFLLGYLLKFYCIFVNISRSVFAIYRNLGFPISQLIIKSTPFFPEDMSDEEVDEGSMNIVKLVGMTWVYIMSGLITYFDEDFAIMFNQALLVASITMRGILSLAWTYQKYTTARKNINGDNRDQKARTGIFKIILTALGFYVGSKNIPAHFGEKLDESLLWWFGPILRIESLIEKSRTMIHNAFGCQ